MPASPYIAGLGRTPAGDLATTFDAAAENKDRSALPYFAWCEGYWTAYNETNGQNLLSQYGLFGSQAEVDDMFHRWWAYDVCKLHPEIPLFQVARELPSWRLNNGKDISPAAGIATVANALYGFGGVGCAEFVRFSDDPKLGPHELEGAKQWILGYLTEYNVSYFEQDAAYFAAPDGFFAGVADRENGVLRAIYDWCKTNPGNSLVHALWQYCRWRVENRAVA